MLLLDVPFLPDPDYVEFLAEFQPALYSVHFSLFLDTIPDGRHRSRVGPEFADLAAGLTRLPGPKKYGLLNSRFHHPSLYTDKAALQKIIKALDTLLTAGTLHGITIVDFYLLQALSDTCPEVASQLEAVPGVNCMLDSFAKVQGCLDAIARTGFKPPAKINLDRSLNRNLAELAEMARELSEYTPEEMETLRMLSEAGRERDALQAATATLINLLPVAQNPLHPSEQENALSTLSGIVGLLEDLLTRAEIPPEASGLVLVRHDGDVRTIACARNDGRIGVLTRKRGSDAALIVDEDAAGHTDVAALRAALASEGGD